MRLLQICGFPRNLEWNLIYRASRDGFSSNSFHLHCDGYPSTLIIVKAATGNIFGGYTEIRWDKSFESKCDPAAFIYSLINRDLRPIKMRIKAEREKFAVRCNPKYGPIFGSGVGNDFAICSDANQVVESYSNLGHCYRHPIYAFGTSEAKSFLGGAYKFRVVEIEVFFMDWDHHTYITD